MNISTMHERLGAPLHNVRWSWGSVNENETRAFLNCWQHETVKINGKYHVRILLDSNEGNYLGRDERRNMIENYFEAGVPTYAIMIQKAPDDWKIVGFDRNRLFKLGTDTVQIDDVLYAPVVNVVPANELFVTTGD